MFAGPLVGVAGLTKVNGTANGHTNGVGALGTLDGEMLETLLVVDYRYARFALDERDGLFKMTKYVFFLMCSHMLETQVGIGTGETLPGRVYNP